MSNVDDHGLEVIRKSAEYVVPNIKADYYLKVGLFGNMRPPAGADTIVASYPSSTVETYEYKSGGLSGTLLKTATVTYTNSTKDRVSSVVWT